MAPKQSDGPQGHQAQDTVAELDPADIKLLPEQRGCGQNDQHREEKIKAAGLQTQRLPGVPDKGKDREGDGEHLVEKENKAIRTRPVGEESPQGIRPVAPPPGNHLGQAAENHQPKGVGDRKRQEPEKSVLEGELNTEKQAQPPHPG